MTPLQQLDLSGLHVLDGAMATELERKGFDFSGPLWSAHVLESSPEAIADVHRDYLGAGADCLLTASYQVSAEGFQKIGCDAPNGADAAANALRASVAIAEKVRSEYQASSPRRIWIAALLGPSGAMLHNGAEYHGNYACGFDQLVGFHRGESRCSSKPTPTSWPSKAFLRWKKPGPFWPRFTPILTWRLISASPAGMSPRFPWRDPASMRRIAG